MTKDEELIEIARCPFCATQLPPVTTKDKQGHIVICTGCSALGPTRRSQGEAIAAWNTRSPSAIEIARFGASEAACYAYPGEDQQPLRDAFCEGAGHYTNLAADRLEALAQPVVGVERLREALGLAISNVPMSEPEKIGDTGRCGAAALTTKQADDILSAVLDALSPLMHRLTDAEAEPLPAGEPLTDDDAVCISVGDLRALRAALAASPSPVVGDREAIDVIAIAKIIDPAAWQESNLVPVDRQPASVEKARNVIDAILSLSTPVVGGGWLPIEQAPKDGTSVLVVIASTAANVTYGENGYRQVLQASFEDDMWLCPACSNLENGCWKVTHFRPLPDPPAIDPHTMDRAGMAQD